MKHIVLLMIIVGALLAFSTKAFANSLVVSNGEVLEHSSVGNTISIKFDIAWENSWRDGVNNDAAWVFLKYSVDDGASWNHATLALSGTNPSGFDRGSGTTLDIVVPTDLKGAFLQRTSSGSGAVSTTDVSLVWDYGLDGVDDSDIESALIIKVFALEMVYIPQGSFYVGDNGTSASSLREGSSDTDPWYVSSGGSINVSNVASNGFYYVSSGYAGEDSTGASFSVGSTFPNGYDAFYVMKYEVSEGQWISFFNTLDDLQKVTRDITGASGKNTDSSWKRNTVSWSSGLASTSREDRACSYLSWMDGAAFADWAALRPLTELEYEKVNRGSDVAAIGGEYSWGDTSIVAATSLSGTENGNETVSNSGANAHFNNTSLSGGDAGQGPLRTGIFATSFTSRSSAGASFYGALDLSGNLSERVVTIGNNSGRAYTGSAGDGVLSVSGNATNSDWPGYASGEITGATGSGIRGGSWSDSSSRLRISDRQESSQGLTSRQSRFGFRAGR